ncbi:S-layer homology domain-containing protein, partial [Patescibacteria group bacterium]
MKKFFLGFLIGILISTSAVSFAKKKSVFHDIEDDEWYTEAVQNLTDLGIITGYEDGSFKPSQKVNRAELVVVLDRLISYIETGE